MSKRPTTGDRVRVVRGSLPNRVGEHGLVLAEVPACRGQYGAFPPALRVLLDNHKTPMVARHSNFVRETGS